MQDITERYPRLLDPIAVEAYTFADCWTKMNPEGPYEELDVAMAILRFNGNLTLVATALGRSRRSVHNFILRQVFLADWLEEVEKSFLDTVEGGYKTRALQGEEVAQRFFLTTKGKNRGYTVRTESSGVDGRPLEVQLELISKDADEFARRMASLAAREAENGVPSEPDGGGESEPAVEVGRVVGETKPD